MKDLLQELALRMIAFDDGDPKRIQHFLKVHNFAKIIAEGEHLDERTQFVLEAAALTHDIGIRPAEEKYGSCSGKLQEQEGPAPARKMLTELGFDAEATERVCYLIAHHHTYEPVDGIDYRILIEADFLVNLFEDDAPMQAVEQALRHIFRTETGIWICKTMFGV